MKKAMNPEAYFCRLLGLTSKELSTLAAEVLAGAEDGELYLERTDIESVSLDEGKVKSPSCGTSQGFGLRRVSGTVTSFASGEDISVAEIRRAGKEMNEIALGRDPYIPADLGKAKKYYTDKSTLTMTLADRVSVLSAIDVFARLDPLVTNVQAGLVGAQSHVLVVRADGNIISDVRPMTRLSLGVQCSNGKKGKDEKREMATTGIGGRYGYDSITRPSVWKPHVEQKRIEAKDKLRAQACPSGEMVVVLGCGWAGVLLHEAIGHGLEADFVWRKETIFAPMIGQRVASDLVTVVDDGTIKGARGSLNRDDEGTPTECTTLIKDGILVGFMHDRQSARLLGLHVTGNGRRESFEHRPQVRMRNTYMLSGNSSPEEIIASTKQGLYIGSFAGGQVDPITGKFIFNADMAYKIEDGKFGAPVVGATLIGNCATVLLHVDMVGNNSMLAGAGTCGKGGQSVPVGIGQPTLRLSGGVSVGGTETQLS